MKTFRAIYHCVLFLAFAQPVCLASSLLVPAKFPKTIVDVDFISQMNLKADDYDRYATLSPYEQLILEKADENIEQQIAQDLAATEQETQLYTPAYQSPVFASFIRASTFLNCLKESRQPCILL